MWCKLQHAKVLISKTKYTASYRLPAAPLINHSQGILIRYRWLSAIPQVKAKFSTFAVTSKLDTHPAGSVRDRWEAWGERDFLPLCVGHGSRNNRGYVIDSIFNMLLLYYIYTHTHTLSYIAMGWKQIQLSLLLFTHKDMSYMSINSSHVVLSSVLTTDFIKQQTNHDVVSTLECRVYCSKKRKHVLWMFILSQTSQSYHSHPTPDLIHPRVSYSLLQHPTSPSPLLHRKHSYKFIARLTWKWTAHAVHYVFIFLPW